MDWIERVLICGSRDFTDKAIFDAAMGKWVAKYGMPTDVIEGCARGADSLAEDWANAHGIDLDGFGDMGDMGDIGPLPATVHTIHHYPADWDKYGKAAGPIRNKQMLVEGKPQAVIAFTHDLTRSRGTANMVSLARAAGLPVWLPLGE